MKKIYRFITAIFILLPLTGVASPKQYGDVLCEYVKNYDGDTLTVTIEAFPRIIGEHIGVRIDGIDTPELRGTEGELKKKAKRAKDTVHTLLKDANIIILRNIKRGKYFRIVAEVVADGVNIGQFLLDHHLAQPYDGGTKQPWENQ